MGISWKRNLVSRPLFWSKCIAVALFTGMGTWDAAEVDAVQFREELILSSPVTIHIRAPDILADISQPDVAALWHLAAAFLQWSAPPLAPAGGSGILSTAPPLISVQSSLLAECGFRCNLQTSVQVGVGLVA